MAGRGNWVTGVCGRIIRHGVGDPWFKVPEPPAGPNRDLNASP